MADTTIVRGMGSPVRPAARCRGGQAKPAKKRTRKPSRNGFLDHRFRSFWVFAGNPDRVARAYFHSLANLCSHYGLTVPQTDLPFPQNIYATWQFVEKQVHAISRDLHCMILQDKGKQAVLSVVKTFDLTQCLFYIPVRAYWQWSQCAGKERITELVTVIFAYLHQVVDVSFYAQGGTFMDYNTKH